MRNLLLLFFLVFLILTPILRGEILASDALVVSSPTPTASEPPIIPAQPIFTPGETPTPSASPSAAPAQSPQVAPSPSLTPSETPSPQLSPSPEQSPEAGPMPRIREIAISGNQMVDTATILSVVTIKIGEEISEDKVNNTLQAIFDLGYFTDVKAATEILPDGIKIIFRVLENPVVQNIEITGNQIVSTGKILELMKTKPGLLLNSKTIFEDVKEIDRYYTEELGLIYSPTHITELTWTPEGILKMTVKEGMVLNKIVISGNTVIKTSALEKVIKSKIGEYVNQKTLKEDTSAIAKLYENKDYILDNIQPLVDRESVTLTFNIVEAVCEEIKVEGNTKTKDYVIKRNIRTKVGEVIKRNTFKRDMERVYNTGYFENVDITPEPGSGPGKVVLRTKVKETKTGLFALGLGYSGGGSGAVRSGISGMVSYNESNLKGKGQSAGFRWQRGVNIDAFSLSYFDPAINDRLDSAGFTFFNNKYLELRQPIQTEPGQYAYAYYDDKRIGGSITYGRQWNYDLKTYFTYRRESINISRNAKSTNDPAGLGEGSLSSLGINNILDTRDDVFNPGEGAYINLSGNFAGGLLKGDFNFTKLQLESRYYIPLPKAKVIALRAWGGALSGEAPISEFFYAGGADTLRGYRDNLFYGTKMLVFNAELRFPIGKIHSLSGAIFADAGNAWKPGDRTQLYQDVGVGARMVLPALGMGAVRLDYAFGEQGSRFSIGFGQTF